MAAPCPHDVLARFDEAPPELVAARALQQRIDRKFLLPAGRLETLLASLGREYFVLPAGRQIWARYESLYFDTPERQLFADHRRGRRPRHKVRIRHHLDRQLTFLEIKSKESSGRTTKARLELPFLQTTLGAPERRFIAAHAPIDPSQLVPCVSVAFLRVTLVVGALNERLTIDGDLRFAAGDRRERLWRVVIAEVKQPRYSDGVGTVRRLRAVHAREQALSKYCLGTILLTPARTNIFKPALRTVERLSA